MPQFRKLHDINNFLKYFNKTWLNGECKIELWNHYENNVLITDNHEEVKINTEITCKNPNLFAFIDIIKSLELDVVLNFKNKFY